MKKQTVIGATAIGMIALSAFTGLHTETYKADTRASSLEWTAEKVGGKHNGIILLSSGELNDEHGKLSGTFVIDMASLATKDMQGECATKLEGHLKSADFFDVGQFPTAKFVTTSITPLPTVKEGGYTHTVKGNLTIKGKTNEISFDAVIKKGGDRIVCVGTAVVDRSKYDVKYGSKSFFPEIGDKMINDEFTLKFNVVAAKNSVNE